MQRNFFQDNTPPAQPEPLVVLGVEEQTDTLLAAQEAISHVENLDQDITRALDIAAGLESLVFVAGKVEKTEPVHRAFFDTGLELALAGTGLESAEIAPGLESDEDLTVSTESVKKTIENIWKTIQRVLASMWESIQKFWKRIQAAMGGIEKVAKDLVALAEERESFSASEKSFSAGRALGRLSVNGKIPTKSSDILDALGDIQGVVNYCTEVKPKELMKCGKDMAKEIADFDFSSTNAAEASLGKLAATCEWDGEKLKKAVKPMKVGRDTRFNASDTVEAIHMADDKSLFIIEHAKTDSEGVLGAAERVRKNALEFMDTSAKKESKKAATEMDVFEVSAVSSIGNTVIAIVQQLAKYDNKDQMKLADDLKKASAKMKGEFDKALKGEEGLSGASAYVDSALKFNIAFSRWATKVPGQLTSHAMATCRAALAVGRSNLSQYKKDAE